MKIKGVRKVSSSCQRSTPLRPGQFGRVELEKRDSRRQVTGDRNLTRAELEQRAQVYTGGSTHRAGNPDLRLEASLVLPDRTEKVLKGTEVFACSNTTQNATQEHTHIHTYLGM